MSVNTPDLDALHESDEFCLVSWSFAETACFYTAGQSFRKILDCACPTTVQCSVKFPCVIGRRSFKLKTEVIDEDFSLLLVNSSLKLACGVIDVGLKKFSIFGKDVDLSEDSSGHLSVEISHPTEESTETAVTLISAVDQYEEKDIWRLHHYFRHASVEKLTRLLKNVGKLNTETKKCLEKVRTCESCRVNDNRKPKPKTALPRAIDFNEVVTLDLKVYDGQGTYAYILYAVDLFSRITIKTFIQKKMQSPSEKPFFAVGSLKQVRDP